MGANSFLHTTRVSAGVPTGGQWREREHPEAARFGLPSTLSDPAWEARLAQLRRAGFVKAASMLTTLDPGHATNRQQWWGHSFVTAGYGHHEGGIEQMPDDNTPAMTPGRSLTGHRRTHRMAYRGQQVTLRMPSATAIRRFAGQSKNRTFDVPASAQTPAGTHHGWVRLTPGTDGRWDAQGLGFDGNQEIYVAEAARAVLESRRPSRALAQVGGLIERRYQREQAQGVTSTPVPSTWIRSLGYDKTTTTMVMTTSGRVYGYHVRPDTYHAVAHSYSPGRAFNHVVKGRAPRVQVRQCPRCARFTSSAAGHQCPISQSERDVQVTNELARDAAAGFARPWITPTASGPSNPAPGEQPSMHADRAWGTHVPAPEDNQSVGVAEWMLRKTKDALRRDPQLPARPLLLGPHLRRGFTADIALDIEPFTDQHHVPLEYAPRNHRWSPVTKNGRNTAGVMVMHGVDAAAAAKMLGVLPAENLRFHHHAAPAVGNLLTTARDNPGLVELNGFLVGPDRDSEGLVIDTVLLYSDADSPAKAQWHARMLGLHATAPPSSVSQVEVPWRPGDKPWRLCWD